MKTSNRDRRSYTLPFVLALFVLAHVGQAATLRVAWDAVPEATSYLVWSGRANGPYERASFTAATAIDLAGLQSATAYRIAVVAFAPGNASLPATIVAMPRTVVTYLEWSTAPSGIWQTQAATTNDAEPGFYRTRVEIR